MMEVCEKNVQIKAWRQKAICDWYRDCIGLFGLSVVIRIPEQQFPFTRVQQAALIRISSFCASRLDRIWMNLTQIGQTWRVSWGLHTLEVDATTLATIARMRKDFRFISKLNSFDFGTLVKFQIVFIQDIFRFGTNRMKWNIFNYSINASQVR